MANLTISVDDNVLRRARIRALQQGTSVNAVLGDYLEAWARDEEAVEAIERFLQRGQASGCGSGPDGRSWRRDELHER